MARVSTLDWRRCRIGSRRVGARDGSMTWSSARPSRLVVRCWLGWSGRRPHVRRRCRLSDVAVGSHSAPRRTYVAITTAHHAGVCCQAESVSLATESSGALQQCAGASRSGSSKRSVSLGSTSDVPDNDAAAPASAASSPADAPTVRARGVSGARARPGLESQAPERLKRFEAGVEDADPRPAAARGRSSKHRFRACNAPASTCGERRSRIASCRCVCPRRARLKRLSTRAGRGHALDRSRDSLRRIERAQQRLDCRTEPGD